MTVPLVLDADGLDALTEESLRIRAILEAASRRRARVIVPAVVCAEVCRGLARARAVEAALARRRVSVVPTDFKLARQVGAILHASRSGTEDIVDAHVVAVCASYGGGVVATADPDDIQRLAQAVPAARIVTRRAR